jgi:hypothetical protein
MTFQGRCKNLRGGAKILRGGAKILRGGAKIIRGGAKRSQGRCAPPLKIRPWSLGIETSAFVWFVLISLQGAQDTPNLRHGRYKTDCRYYHSFTSRVKTMDCCW